MIDYGKELIQLTDRQLLLLIAGISVADVSRLLDDENATKLIRLTKTIE